MINPKGFKPLSALPVMPTVAPGDEIIFLQEIGTGGRATITTASTVIVTEAFTVDDVPSSVQPSDTILLKRGTDLYKVDIGDIAAGVLDNRAALSVVGNPTNAAAGGVDITAGSNNTVLRRASNALSFGKVARADLANSAAVSVIGRSANSSGAPGDIAAASNNQVLKRKSNALVFGQVETDDIAAQAVTSDEIDMSDLIGALIDAGVIPAAWGTISSAGGVTNRGALNVSTLQASTGIYNVSPPAGYTIRAFIATAQNAPDERIVVFLPLNSPKQYKTMYHTNQTVNTAVDFICYLTKN